MSEEERMWQASKAEASGGLPMLARYKVWANDLLYAAVARLPAHELIAPRPQVERHRRGDAE